ncbi:RNA-guided endonuclease TnpB family protein [Sulfobacillus harzensis]|uniref:Transposase n=1 Tax=Sulfobacillus harzensis TaxID=2729629 RepID=A0A7Y0L6G7_9FIRM|nr:RNA-guided endonuclease TnpB family protein [Sulfobacillus harzensis]NMP24100.1 transposase [Sulfobacillus harzensis]
MPSSSSTLKTKSRSERRRATTPSFVCEVPLRVIPTQEDTLQTRFEAARQLYNALLGEALKRLRLLQQSRAYQTARRLARTQPKQRAAAFARARQAVGFTEFALSQYATAIHQSWIGDHVDAVIGQTLTKRAFQAVNRMALAQAKKVRFKGQRGLHQISSLEGKSNAAGLRWRNDALHWGDLILPMVPHADRDPVIAYGLAHRIKYVRLVRRTINGRFRWFAQLVCEGLPMRKIDPKTGQFRHPYGSDIVGLDIGPSTIAIVGETRADLRQFAEEVVHDHAEIRRLQRHLDRQRRANNPDCYDAQGRVIKGKRPTNTSRQQQFTENRLQELSRRETAHRKTLHGQLANQVMAQGTTIKTEKLSYKAFQKRFGRSISVRAPKLFLSILTRKAESAGGQVIEFNTRTTALSQTCLCGQKHKKRLSERIHTCGCGVTMQRDLFSAYLARFVEDDALQVARATEPWPGAEPLLRTAWQRATTNQPASGRPLPSSFGRYPSGPSQSGSSEKENLPEHKAADVVTSARPLGVPEEGQVEARAAESVKV